MHPLRRRYIAAGFITPDPVRSQKPWSAEALDERGFHAAAAAKRKASV